MKKRIYLMLLLSIIALAGCARKNQGLNNGSVSASDQMGFLFLDGDGALFIRWTDINKHISGQLQIFRTNPNGNGQIESTSHSFEGVCDGHNISINFTGSIWTSALSGQTWTGTLNADELTLFIPTQNGSLLPTKLKSGTVEQYNEGVAAVTQAITNRKFRIEQERMLSVQTAKQQQAVASANEAVKKSIGNLVGSTNQLRANARLDDILGDYNRNLTKMVADHATLKANGSKFQGVSYEPETLRMAIETLRSDMESIRLTNEAMTLRLRALDQAVKAITAEIASLRHFWQTLKKADSVNSSGTPKSEFIESDILRPISEAEKENETVTSMIKAGAQQAHTFENRARDLYKSAQSIVSSVRSRSY